MTPKDGQREVLAIIVMYVVMELDTDNSISEELTLLSRVCSIKPTVAQ